MKRIRVFLADDHTLFREGLRSLLEAADDMEVAGEAENGHQAVSEIRRLLPDVVIMDIAMPLLNGLEATRQIHRISRSVRVQSFLLTMMITIWIRRRTPARPVM